MIPWRKKHPFECLTFLENGNTTTGLQYVEHNSDHSGTPESRVKASKRLFILLQNLRLSTRCQQKYHIRWSMKMEKNITFRNTYCGKLQKRRFWVTSAVSAITFFPTVRNAQKHATEVTQSYLQIQVSGYQSTMTLRITLIKRRRSVTVVLLQRTIAFFSNFQKGPKPHHR